MKTLEQVKAELAECAKITKEQELTKKESRKLEKRIKSLYSCQLYLETNPTVEFVEKQRNDNQKKIKIINDGFAEWLKSSPRDHEGVKNPKSKYQTLMGLKNIKAQIATLNYLLAP